MNEICIVLVDGESGESNKLNCSKSFYGALLVMAGKYGIGAERKEKLTAAGFNYNEVQTAVNEIVGVI